ncbi:MULTISPECIES: hypothetical protein [unclassified Pseudomonas]|nr:MULTISPECIES: hypothetical protein [unclassified Pseudomonas]
MELPDARMNAGAVPIRAGLAGMKKNWRMVVQNFTSPGMIARPDACW